MTAGAAPESATLGDRFAHWRPWPARLALLALVLLIAAAAFAPIHAGKQKVKTRGFVENMAAAANDQAGPERERDEDLALYDVAIERIRKGENYYDFIVAEHRKAHWPVRPGFAVRLPTLVYLDAWLGEGGQIAASLLLLAATMLAWWRRLGEEPGGERKRVLAMAFLFIGTSLGLNRYFFVLHELWSGMLLALAFGLHRVAGRQDPPPPSALPEGQFVLSGRPAGQPKGAATSPGGGGSWIPSLLVAALALAIREHALPFVLLMAAMAFWRRDWREGVAWSALALAFLALLAWHLAIIAAQALPSEPLSSSWLTFRGLSGWLSNVVLSSNLRFLPHWLAGPALVLAMLGWAGWRSPMGEFGTLLYLGYGLAFMIAGRPDNYYWGFMVGPAILVGAAFAPQALGSLLTRAFPK